VPPCENLRGGSPRSFPRVVMKIKVLSDERQFTAILHFAIEDQNNDLICLSIAGLNTAVKGMLGSAVEGRILEIENGPKLFAPKNTSWKLTAQNAGDLTYGFLIQRNLIPNKNESKEITKDKDEEEEKPEDFLIIAPDGDLVTAVGNFFAEKFQLPNEEKHIKKYYNIFKKNYEAVNVIKNPLIDKWKDLKAVKIKDITEKAVLDKIDVALAMNVLDITGDGEGYFDPAWDMKEYLSSNAAVMAKAIDKMAPYHNMQKLDPVIATLGRIPLPAQAHAAQALYNRFKESNYAFFNGEVGTGKSIGTNALVKIMAQDKPLSVLLTAPATVLPKWVSKEILEDIPGAKVRTINSTEDILKFRREIKNGYKPKGIEFTLVSIDRVKLGPNSWAGAALWRRQRIKDEDGRLTELGHHCWHCPDCFKPLASPVYKDEFVPAAWEDMANGKPTAKRNEISWKTTRTSQLLPIEMGSLW